MCVWAAAKRPMELTFRIHNRQVVDTRVAAHHEALLVELPVFVAIGAVPVTRVVVPFVSEAHCNAVVGLGPQFLD
jgi:hypothetical protein